MKFYHNTKKMAGFFLLALTLLVAGCGDDNPTGGNGSDELAINSINPTSGMVGDAVTITGNGFSTSAEENAVTFTDGVTAEVTSASATELEVTVPDGAETGPITVEVDGESVTTSGNFVVNTEPEPEVPQEYQNLPGNKNLIAEDKTWANDTTIAGPVYVLPGVTLTVEEGVTVEFEYHNNNAADVGTIITLPADDENFTEDRPSGRLVAQGSADNPIVFTSTRKQVASWGGIILAGEASNNVPGGRGEIEGLSEGVQYGADIDGGESFNDEDDSGILSYVQINYSGYSISDGSELQALTLYSVGSGTQIDHISIFRSVDDGIELFGGTVDVKYMAIVGAQDDTFDWDNGWTGRGQFWVGVQTLPANRGFENDGCATTSDCDGGQGPTAPQIYNVTIWGNDTDNGETIYGVYLRELIEGAYNNIVVANFGKSTQYPIYVEEDDGSSDKVGNELTFGGNISWRNANAATTPLTYDTGITEYEDDAPLFTNPEVYDFSLVSNSDALTEGVDIPSDDFFDQVDFSGAVGEGGSDYDWTTGANWIKWEE